MLHNLSCNSNTETFWNKYGIMIIIYLHFTMSCRQTKKSEDLDNTLCMDRKQNQTSGCNSNNSVMYYTFDNSLLLPIAILNCLQPKKFLYFLFILFKTRKIRGLPISPKFPQTQNQSHVPCDQIRWDTKCR